MVRITIISNYWKKSQGGGIATYLIHLYQALQESGAIVRVISRNGIDPQQMIIPGTKLKFIWKTRLLLRQNNHSPIITNNDWYCLLPAILRKWKSGIPVVHIFHTWPEEKMSVSLRWLMRFLLSHCTHIVFVSEALREYYQKNEGIYTPHSTVIRAGFPPVRIIDETEKEEYRKQWNIQPGDIVICTQAMTAHKEKARGVKVLVEAIRKLNSTLTVHLLVTKNGKYRKVLETEVRDMGMQNRVHFTGDIENVYLPLSISNYYVHITFAEGGVSLSILEAISKNIPIIATATGGIKELLTHNETAILVEPDPVLIANAIENLILNPETAEKITRISKSRLEPSFSWKENARRFLSLLKT